MNKSKLFLLLRLFALSVLFALLTISAHAWRVSIEDCPGCSGRAPVVVVDAAGDIIAAGRVYYGGEVVKLSGETGRIIWQFNSTHREFEQGISALAIDSKGDVFVGFDSRRSVLKISGDTGKRIWEKPAGGTTTACFNYISSIVVDRDDNVVTAGTSGCFFNVAKLDGLTGDQKWHYEREGYAKAVAVDPFGNVAAAGVMNRNFAVVKLRGENGAELWQREINGAGNFTDVFEEANAVAMDKDGSVVATGATNNEIANFRDFTVARYFPDGRVHWVEIIDGQRIGEDDQGKFHNQSNDMGNAVVIDKDGDVIAAGSIQQDEDVPATKGVVIHEHFRVIKIARDGGVVWSEPAEEPPPDGEYIRGWAFALSVNAAGNVVAGGLHGGRFTLVKFWGRTGGRAWRRQLTSGMDASENGNTALGVVMDSASDVIAAGEAIGTDGLSKFTVVKLRRADGLDFGSDPTPPPPPEAVVKYAPVVYLHSEDKYRPDDPMSFIRSSKLKWSHQAQSLLFPCEDHTDAELGAVDVERLGASALSPYAHRPKNHSEISCDHRMDIPPLNAYERTRPFDGAKRDNVLGREEGYMREGYYLDPNNDDNELRNGIQAKGSVFPGAPVFYEYRKHRYVTYWFFYPYDKFETPLLTQEHEGDWERISVQLDSNDELVKVFYYHHDDGMRPPLGLIEFEGTHPVVYSAKGSHGSYPAARDDYATKVPGLFDHTNRGPKWSTWNNLLEVESQPWYGFGGAWGEVGELPEIAIPFVGKLSGSDWTGPLGPSPYKTSLETWASKVPPQLNLPADITVNATGPLGAIVHYTVTATDDTTQSPQIACNPPSGSLFQIGTTTVACTATDDAGNTANGTFKITVKGAADQTADLITLTKGFALPNGTENSLVVKLQNALAKAKAGDKVAACNQLVAFANEVRAQSGKKISVTQANRMLTAADQIRAVIGCR